MTVDKVKKIYSLAEARMKDVHIRTFPNTKKPIFMISEQYPGVWLEHLYDSVMYARLYPEMSVYMNNIIELFIEHQTEDGQLPCYIFNKDKISEGSDPVGYGQIQECLSFASVCLMAYDISGDRDLLSRCYTVASAWVEWLKKHRMTSGRGLIEMFVGFDTGHDRSSRLNGLSCIGNYQKNGILQNAGILPENDSTAPVLAVDMNCNYYGNLTSLAKMADILDKPQESQMWNREAEKIKKRLFELCFDKDDAFFYDVDKNGNMRRVRSSTILHLFLEGVLDRDGDAEIIREIYKRHIKNPEEFWTPCPLPSVAYNDPSTAGHESFNSWGYFCQLLIYLRCTVWMDKYGFSEDLDFICEKVLGYLTEAFDKVKLGQELDPITGEPSPSSEWYSSCMLFYIYAVRRLDSKRDKKY